MSTNRSVTPLELYVIAYFRQKSRKLIGKIFVEKALALVDEKLGVPCCIDPTSSVNLHTSFENELTTRIRALLNGMPIQGNKQSLNRVHRLLYKYLNPPCCV